jgi:hypothetical protein
VQLQNLELEKISMQQELDSLTDQAKVQSIAAEDSLIMVIICFPLVPSQIVHGCTFHNFKC